MENCKCGSGISKNKCHNTDDINQIRKTIRVGFFQEQLEKERVTSFFPLRSVDFDQSEYKGILKFQIAQTPAGLIIYPLFLKKADRCVRPLTIDGQLIIDDGEVELVHIPCMLTPIHFAQIVFNTKNIKRDKLSIGSFTVNCEIKTKGNPFESCFAMEMKGNQVALYHHTSLENEKSILESGYFKGSKWSLQGTNELKDYHNIYFTSITKIEDGYDLFEIGMCEKGTDHLIVTDDDKVEAVEVYRENRLNRPSSIKVWVDWEMISTNHLVLHNDKQSHLSPTLAGSFSWWEVFMPYIYRVPIKINSYLKHTYNPKKNEYKLKLGQNFFKTDGFSAALGTDLHGLKINWSEVRTERINPKSSDYGQIDNKWVEIWENNFTKLTNSILEESLLKVSK